MEGKEKKKVTSRSTEELVLKNAIKIWTSLDAFGTFRCVWMRLDAFGHVWTRLDAFGQGLDKCG